MYIIKMLIFISTFLFTLNVLAFANTENTKFDTYNQTSSLIKVEFNQENLLDPSGTKDVGNRYTMTSSSLEVSEVDFFTKLCIYLIIIMVYWLYWLKNTPT